MKRNRFLIGMASAALVLGMAGCDSIAAGAKKIAEGMSSYTIVLANVVNGDTYTAVVYDSGEATGGGVAEAVNGSASIRLTPYNGKPAFSERTYRVQVSSGATVKEAASVAFVASGNTPLSWGSMTVISEEPNGDDNSKGMSSYTIVLANVVNGNSYTAVVYDGAEATGGGVAEAVNGSASIRLTPYNGKPAFSERTYRVQVISAGTVKEAASVAFVASGNTPLDWGTMTVISAYTSEDGISTRLVLTAYSAPKIGETFNYALYRSGILISSGRVTINSAASWSFTANSGGFTFMGSFSGGTLAFSGKINDTVSGYELTPVSGVPAPAASGATSALTVNGAEYGVSYEAKVYNYPKAVTDAEALNTVISLLAPTGTGLGIAGNETLKIYLKNADSTAFNSNGKFLVVLKDAADGSAPLKYKSAVTFTGGSAIVEYDDMETAFRLYTVTFYTGAFNPPANQKIKEGGKITLPSPSPTREGYTLDGWYRNEYGTGTAWDFNSPVTADITLYAKWIDNSIIYHTVTFHANGGAPADFTQTVADGDKVTPPALDPTKTGYTFDGWFTSTAYAVKWDFDTNTVTTDIGLYAKWKPASTYGISVDVSGTHTFPGAIAGYSAQTAKSVNVTNTGNQPTGNLTVALSSSSAFTLSATSISSIAAAGSDYFTVRPKTGLAPGTHTATVTVSGGNGIFAGFSVSFTVNAATYGISLNTSGTWTFPAATAGYSAQTAKNVTITNTGNQPTGTLTLALSSSSAFTLSATTISSITAGASDTFYVFPNTGLPAGTYTAAVTVSGLNITSKNFSVSFTVNAAPTYGISLNQSETWTFPAATAGYGAQIASLPK